MWPLRLGLGQINANAREYTRKVETNVPVNATYMSDGAAQKCAISAGLMLQVSTGRHKEQKYD